MALPLLIQIERPFIVLSGSSSIGGIVPQPNSGNYFGIVEQTYPFCDVTVVRNSVFFDAENAKIFFIDDVEYYLINENKILFTEREPS